ncbi:hypothetical protein NONI108955_20965 [Nocardia ninae]|uniref:Uncharacterized protein n=1 Tax=Nocardia ninae NBRC 108245 TaxID=1210091 RepID=A0A511M9U3_9NOCA|nr:hypothetical protein [Nocardia ninae]GEM37425.1 hypothetical protein NN4_19440 [Nocardia ninae NBRC 108245]
MEQRRMSTLVAKGKDGNVVAPGSPVTDFRGETAEFKYASRANTEGKDGKVVVRMVDGWEPEHYARVWGLTVEQEARRG